MLQHFRRNLIEPEFGTDKRDYCIKSSFEIAPVWEYITHSRAEPAEERLLLVLSVMILFMAPGLMWLWARERKNLPRMKQLSTFLKYVIHTCTHVCWCVLHLPRYVQLHNNTQLSTFIVYCLARLIRVK